MGCNHKLNSFRVSSFMTGLTNKNTSSNGKLEVADMWRFDPLSQPTNGNYP